MQRAVDERSRDREEAEPGADVVGIFPNKGPIIRLIGAVLLKQNDEWQTQHRYMQVEGMAGLIPPTIDGEATPFPAAPVTPQAA